jgi:hypothetical protein
MLGIVIKLEDFCVDVDDQGLGILGLFGKWCHLQIHCFQQQM